MDFFFFAAGNVLTEKRDRLLPQNVDKVVFMHENVPYYCVELHEVTVVIYHDKLSYHDS